MATETPPCLTAGIAGVDGTAALGLLFAAAPVFFRLDFATALAAAVLPVEIIAALLAARFALRFQT